MTVNTQMLRDQISRKNMTIREYSTAIGIDPSTFYRKLDDGGIKFTVGQMHRTVEVLDLSKEDAVQIFLN